MLIGVVLCLPAGAATATTAASPEPSPILIDDAADWRFDADCAYYLTMYTTVGNQINHNDWIWLAPNRSFKLRVEVGRQTDFASCAEIVRQQSAGGTIIPGDVLLDMQGDGTFEHFQTQVDGQWVDGVFTPKYASRTGPYLITAIWVAPNGNRIVNQLAVYAGTTASVSINDGAEYTNDPIVKLNLAPEPGARYVSLSNDAGFKDAQVMNIAATLPWRLRSGVTGLLTKMVYVRFLAANGKVMSSFSDDIVLDTTAPVIQSASLTSGRARVLGSKQKSVTIAVSAFDKTSGVDRLQVSSSKSARGASSARYKPTTSVQRPEGGAKFVRVSDGAGNWSKWRRVA